ncbi:MAG: DoxX family protein [Bacteroidaceae bacterium]|nr:DoxX family protein [Bacteroidaceae bacterium]
MCKNDKYAYSKGQIAALLFLRIVIGWHFLYEGIAKILNPKWSSYGYLMDAKGFLADFYHWIAGNPTMLEASNLICMVGLTLVGLGLILGCFSRCAAFGGILFLCLFYFSHIPYIGAEYGMPFDGSYLWLDKSTVEIAALIVLIMFPSSRIIGVDRLWKCCKCSKNKE